MENLDSIVFIIILLFGSFHAQGIRWFCYVIERIIENWINE